MAKSGKSILIVDDEKLIRWSLCAALIKDFVIYTAESAEEGLNLLGRVRIDAVITDLRMPGMGGMKLAETLKERFPGIPVFAITAYSSPEATRELRLAGVRECLPKPFQVEDLRAMLERHLESVDSTQ